VSRRAPLFAAAAFSLLAVSGCGRESSDPTAAANGIWKTDHGWYLEFTDDGNFGLGGSADRTSSAPVEWGTFTFDGVTLRLTTADDSTYCTGTKASYTAVPSDDGDSWVPARHTTLGIQALCYAVSL